MDWPATRKEALAVKERFYFTGKPCPKGHISKRYASGGNRGKCVECFKAKLKLYMVDYQPKYRASNLEKARGYDRKYCATHKDERKARTQRWRDVNPEKSRVSVTRWREANRDRFREICCEWARNNKDKVHAHRAMRLSADGSFTRTDVAEIMLDQKGQCAMPICRKKLGSNFHLDHIVPLKRGGSNWRRNLQLLCPTCNKKKGARDPIDHARSLGLLL